MHRYETHLILLDQRILWLIQDPHQILDAKRMQRAQHRQPTEELWYQAVRHQIGRLQPFERDGVERSGGFENVGLGGRLG
jgi:hypothetical protein